MTKKDFIDSLAESLSDYSYQDIKLCTEYIFDTLLESLCEDKDIEIRGVGSMSIRHYESKVGRDPRDGEQVLIDDRISAHFKAGNELKNLINS